MAELLQAHLPSSKVVKAFNHIIASQLISNRCWADHSDMADAKRLRADLLKNQGEFGKAIDTYEDLIDTFRKNLRKASIQRMSVSGEVIKAEMLYIDILNNMEVIGDHSLKGEEYKDLLYQIRPAFGGNIPDRDIWSLEMFIRTLGGTDTTTRAGGSSGMSPTEAQRRTGGND